MGAHPGIAETRPQPRPAHDQRTRRAARRVFAGQLGRPRSGFALVISYRGPYLLLAVTIYLGNRDAAVRRPRHRVFRLGLVQRSNSPPRALAKLGSAASRRSPSSARGAPCRDNRSAWICPWPAAGGHAGARRLRAARSRPGGRARAPCRRRNARADRLAPPHGAPRATNALALVRTRRSLDSPPSSSACAKRTSPRLTPSKERSAA